MHIPTSSRRPNSCIHFHKTTGACNRWEMADTYTASTAGKKYHTKIQPSLTKNLHRKTFNPTLKPAVDATLSKLARGHKLYIDVCRVASGWELYKKVLYSFLCPCVN